MNTDLENIQFTQYYDAQRLWYISPTAISPTPVLPTPFPRQPLSPTQPFHRHNHFTDMPFSRHPFPRHAISPTCHFPDIMFIFPNDLSVIFEFYIKYNSIKYFILIKIIVFKLFICDYCSKYSRLRTFTYYAKLYKLFVCTFKF